MFGIVYAASERYWNFPAVVPKCCFSDNSFVNLLLSFIFWAEGDLHSDVYHLVIADLRDIDSLEGKLQSCDLDFRYVLVWIFLFFYDNLVHKSDTLGWVRSAKAARLDSNHGRGVLKTGYLRSVQLRAQRWWVGARKRFMRTAAIDSLSVQRLLRKQPRVPRYEEAEMDATDHSAGNSDTLKGVQKGVLA